MVCDYLLYISQPKSKTFHIMQVSSMNPIELIEYFFKFSFLIPRPLSSTEIHSFPFSFHVRIFKAISRSGLLYFTALSSKLNTTLVKCISSTKSPDPVHSILPPAYHCFLYFQTEGIHHSINQLMCVNFLFLKRHTLSFKHRHLQHLFYLKTQTLRFVIDNS